MTDFLAKLFDTSDFPARWYCGRWTEGHGWLHILSDLGVWSAYMTIPGVLGYFIVRRRGDLPFPWIFWLFAAFITACGTTHLMQAAIFWWPAYRFAGLVTLATAVLSWSTVIALAFVAPKALTLRTPLQLELEVQARTEQLTDANEALRAEIRERKRTAAERDRLAAIVENSNDAVVGETIDGIVTDWNRGAEKLFGYTAEEIVGQSISQIVPREREAEYLAAMEKLRHGHASPPFETVRVRKDGSHVHVSISLSPIRDEQGQIVAAAKIARDISSRVEAEHALREANRHKDEFLAMLGHELRNPLAPVRSGLALLRCGAEGTERDEVLDTLERQTDHLVRLVDDLLDVSRVASGRIVLRQETVDIHEVVRRAVETVRPEVDAAGHSLAVELADEPLVVQGDTVRLTQVVANLLHNAAKYTSAGGSITIRAERQDDRVQVRVRDSGMGIDSTLLPHIFDLFVQGSRTVERSQGGMGLGLTLVKKLVELHSGSVTAHSGGPGQGSEFTISLPLRQDSSISPPGQTAIAKPTRPLRVLVIEDNVASAELLKKLLFRLWNHDVRIAHDGPAGLEEAIAFEPELIICDIGLPGMDGHEVCRRLREQPQMQDALLVALTGYGTEEDHRTALEAGFDEHLAKPASVQMLERLSQHPKLVTRPG